MKFAQSFFFLLSFFFLSNLQDQNALPSDYENKCIKGEIIIKLKDTPQNKARKRGNAANVGIDALHLVCKQIGNYEIEQFGKNLKQPTIKRKNRPNINNILILKYKEDIDIKKSIKELMKTGFLEYAEPNYTGKYTRTMSNNQMLVPNDYNSQIYWAHNDGTFPGFVAGQPAPKVDADIDAVEAWDITTGSPIITVAILDRGIF